MKKKLAVISLVYIVFMCSIVVYRVAGKNEAYYNYKKLVKESLDKVRASSGKDNASSKIDNQNIGKNESSTTVSGSVKPEGSTSGNSGEAANHSTDITEGNGSETYSNVKFSRNLAMGSTGEDVKKLQYILKEKGFYKGEITGSFDRNTSRAMIDYQKAKNIKPADGICGPGTWSSF